MKEQVQEVLDNFVLSFNGTVAMWNWWTSRMEW